MARHLNLINVIDDIAVCSYDVRLALVKGSGRPLVRYCVARRLDRQERAQSTWDRLEYDEALFLRGTIQGKILSSWLEQKSGRINDSSFEFPVQDQVWVNQVPSNTSYGCIALDVPSLRYSMSLTEQTDPDRGRPLVAEGCPYYPTFQAAALELLFGYTDNDTASPEPVTIVWPFLDAYVASVSVRPLTMDIQVEGALESPAVLHVFGRQPSLHHMVEVSSAARIQVPLLEGVPKEAHVVLARGNSLLDRKFVYASTQGETDLQDPASLQALIARGENEKVEFKVSFPRHHDQWLKTVVAFANRDGGVLIFGVDPDNGHPVGVGHDAIDQYEAIVSNQISTRVDPGINAQVHRVRVEGNPLVVVKVSPGVTKPYSLVTKSTDKGVSRRYFYRIGSSSFEAHPEHIRMVVLGSAREDISTGLRL